MGNLICEEFLFRNIMCSGVLALNKCQFQSPEIGTSFYGGRC